MSKVVIAGDASGTGTFTISAPNGNTNRTLVLPDEAGTVLTSAGVPVSAMPAGSVLQVVHSVITSTFSTTSTSFVDSGLTATITPTSSTSKIFALLSISFQSHGSAGPNGAANFNLVRDSTELQIWRQRTYSYNGAGVYLAVPNSVYMDSPATTSATTYKIQMLSNAATAGINSELGSSCITLFEIAG